MGARGNGKVSQVADVILTCSLSEELGGHSPDGRQAPSFSKLSDWLTEQGKSAPGFGLVRVDARGGGFKAMQCVVSIGAFNYLDIPAFLAFAWSLDWHSRDLVQIMIKDEEEETFTVYRHGESPVK